jgi:hypothetical protein
VSSCAIRRSPSAASASPSSIIPTAGLAIRYRGLDLPYTTFDKLGQVSQATIVENTHLGAVPSQIRERQLERAEARSRSAPRRQGQVNHLFKLG